MSELPDPIKGLIRGVTHPDEELTRLQRAVRDLYRVGRYAGYRLARERAFEMAAALSYRTLFSLIPVLVLSLLILRAFYGDQGIKNALNTVLEFAGIDNITITVPITEEADAPEGEEAPGAPATRTLEATEWIGEFVEAASQRIQELNLGAVTIVAVGIFIYAALSLLIETEMAFNVLARAPRGRRWVTRLTTYWTVLTLGSVALAASFAIGNTYTNMMEHLPSWAAWTSKPLGVLLELGLTWLLLLFLYMRMPAVRLHLQPAAAGAALAALFWQLGKEAFGLFIGSLTAGPVAVYGALALLPLFLFWVYVLWVIVLFGFLLAHSLQAVAQGRWRTTEERVLRQLRDPLVGLVVLRAVAECFAKGRTLSVDDLALRANLDDDLTLVILNHLSNAALVHRVEHDDEHAGYTLARPPESIRVREVLDALEPLLVRPIEADDDRLLRSLRRTQARAIDSQSLAELLGPSVATPAQSNKAHA